MGQRRDDILLHFGVKGMRWGVTKQESSRVSTAKQQVSTTKRRLKGVKKIAAKQSMGGLVAVSESNQKKIKGAELDFKFAKQDVSNARILDKLERKGKSKYQLKMEDKYKQKGLNDDEAAVAAYKNIRMKKILIATAVLTATVVAVKIHDERVDKLIKAGSSLQRVTSESDVGVRDAFYAANHPLDKIKYKGIYGDSLSSDIQNTYGQVFKKDLKVLADVKQASPKNAQKVFLEMMNKDPKFEEAIHDKLFNYKGELGPGYAKKVAKAQTELIDGKYNKHLYETFNAMITDHSPEQQQLTDSYFKKMAEKGYNAIRDVNDSKYSGYKSKNPVIAFGTTGKIVVDNVSKLSSGDIERSKKIGMAAIVAPTIAAQIAAQIAAPIAAVNVATHVVGKRSSNAAVNSYKEEHPGTKLSTTEIARMLERR